MALLLVIALIFSNLASHTDWKDTYCMHVRISMVYKILWISWYASHPTKINPQNLHNKPNSSSLHKHVPLTLSFNAHVCSMQYVI